MLETVDALVSSGRKVVVSLPGDGPLVAELETRGATVRFCLSPVLRKSALRPMGFIRLLAQTAVSLPKSLSLIRQSSTSVVLVNTVTVPLWILVARIARRPVICHVHEAEASASLLIKRAIAFPLLFANRLIVNSKFSLAVLTMSFDRLGRKSDVVLNAVPGPAVVTAARTELGGSMRVLYVGRLSPRKGPDVAIEALDHLRSSGISAHLDVVGAPFPGYEWFEQELRQQVTDRKLTSQVTFCGFKPDVLPFLMDADLVVVPSIKDEPFGNTAVEAVLSGRPVVVSATSGLVEAVDGYSSAQRVTPGSAGSLAAAIETIHDNWPRFRAQALSDSAAAQRRHAPAAYAAQLTTIVDSVS